MENDLFYLIQDDSVVPYALGPRRCAVCPSKNHLQYCGGCKVVSYCSRQHQSAHRSKHKSACDAIANTRQSLEQEEHVLRHGTGDQLSMPANVFQAGVGRFWDILGTRNYMRARFAAADALLKVNTTAAVEKALEHFTDMLRLCRIDHLGVRDIIPHLLLRLGKEQECYDFLKWWAVIDDEDHYNGRYDWGDVTLPYLDIHSADAFESIDSLIAGNSSFSHLVALTLLKLRLWLDLGAYEAAESEFGFDGLLDPSSIDRPIGRLVQVRIHTIEDISETTEIIESQYSDLCRAVQNANAHFWEVLISGAEGVAAPSSHCSPGSPEEADWTLYQCKRAWEESEDAIMMIESNTAEFTSVYEGPAAVTRTSDARSSDRGAGIKNLEMRRASGKVFPTRFEPTSPTASPAELFPATPIGPHQTHRFVCREDRSKALVYVDGACSNNGQPEPRAGWAVVFGPSDRGEDTRSNLVSGRLEDRGPFGESNTATSNRAELRAAIASLLLCDWQSFGFDSIVIATDSAYVVDGATEWAKGWVRNGWKTRTGSDAKNRDLWELLLSEVERCKEGGLQVGLWKIPRELNRDADAAAKKVANEGVAKAEFGDMVIDAARGATMNTNPRPPPRILALCLGNEAMFENVYAELIALITSKAKMERATTKEAALDKLNQEPPPPVIIVADGALSSQRVVWDRIIDRLRGGATVILAGCFSSMTNTGQFHRLFARLGVAWKRGSYDRANLQLQRDVVGGHLTSQLPAEYWAKVQFLENVESSAVWYAPTDIITSRSQAAVAFAKIGQSMLGYIGDVNGEQASNKVVLAMCGVAS